MPNLPVPPSSDAAVAALLDRATRGDADATGALVTRLHATVYRWALGLTGDPDEADDVAQETFVRMHLRLAQYDGDAPLAAWMYRIVRRVAGQRGRTARRRARLAALPAARPDGDAYVTDPGARVDREALAAEARAYFGTLPPRQREIFDLVDLQGYDPIEVAAMTGINPSTVRANLFKARAAVRAHLLARHADALEILR